MQTGGGNVTPVNFMDAISKGIFFNYAGNATTILMLIPILFTPSHYGIDGKDGIAPHPRCHG